MTTNINNSNTAIKITKLKKIYNNNKSDPVEALKGINLNIPKKSIYGLLGPNGAGKSTLINIIAGLVIKTEGEVVVWGNNIDTNSRNAKLAIGVVPQELIIDPFFTPIETLQYQSGFYGVVNPKNIIEEVLKSVGLQDKANSYARSLSGGMRRRLMIAKAMVHRPPILILDEPTAGVDVELRQLLWKNIKILNSAGVTIVLTTHYLEEAEAMCDQLAIINEGRVVAQGVTSEMIAKLDKKELIILTEKNYIKNINLKNVKFSLLKPNKIKVTFKPSEVNEGNIIEKIYESGTKIKSIISREPDLEELFLELTKKT
ncbi:MAG: Daunorubicin/doxorubicin resistance ATP-binding protein DrrA [Alphaproteobacteria bacterium MarineAlpha9_Bin2]|nr:MAG: Daunorubicin/doxorubicin resistance ATP-binding protein DrrA [Alphaproteobacteria bacterium MarineAlpha9_Bin1]PPR29687.1 MAG: Daunorubicin/doxorubicin resistance ATP-binding protein DrrA [Alphaproteobacteria bacterium MarineAlpha9_Bin2]